MKSPDINQLAEGVLKGDFVKLAQAITLVESDSHHHWQKANELLSKIKSANKPVLRIGISGPPGVGKSTFIEALGTEYLKSGKKLAVLAVDPSSEISGGSILGDKTRMENLSRQPNAFVRPSPSRGHLGGVTTSMPAILNLCEAAGFDLIVIETVGVGQSEAAVRLMVDKLILLAQPGAGDDLQGIKKGILEYVDYIVVNKMDLDPKGANAAKTQLLSALKVMRGKEVPVVQASSANSSGIGEVVKEINKWQPDLKLRDQYSVRWFKSLLVDRFIKLLETDERKSKLIKDLESKITSGSLLPTEACDQLFNKISFK